MEKDISARSCLRFDPAVCFMLDLIGTCLLVLVCVVMFSSAVVAQVNSTPHPKVLLEWPEGITSEKVGIDYELTGPFGGYGMLSEAKPKENKIYTIDAAVKDVPAENVKVIAWIPGCEIITLDVPIEKQNNERRLECRPLASIRLKGQLSSDPMETSKQLVITVDYLAEWSHAFFGISDGMVTRFRVGVSSLNADGSFEVSIPDLGNQKGMDKANFEFSVRDQATGNILAFLKPVLNASETHGLKLLHEYPDVVDFTVEPLSGIAH